MIVVTRRNGAPFALNPDLIERVEETPDTVITLVGGTRYVVAERVADLVERIRAYRASVLSLAERLVPEQAASEHAVLRLVPPRPEEA